MGMKLNLACGVNLKPIEDGWVNVDLHRKGVDVERIDLTKPWPWADGSAEYVYCEHFLEHLEYPKEAMWFVKACHKVLGTGGIVRIGVPDLWRLMSWYVRGGDKGVQEELNRWSPTWADNPMDRIQYQLRMRGEHKWGYDDGNLGLLLRRVGFREVSMSAWTDALDSEARRPMTLYMEGTKP